VTIWFNVQLDTLQVILEMIFPVSHLTGTKPGPLSKLVGW